MRGAELIYCIKRSQDTTVLGIKFDEKKIVVFVIFMTNWKKYFRRKVFSRY